jgi:hypothetical protein
LSDDRLRCVYCGVDLGLARDVRTSLRLRIGDEEFSERVENGDFDADVYCEARPRDARGMQ